MAVLRYFHQPPKATTSTVVVNNTAILTVSAALNNKVDKSAGRGLSQNNYSTPEKNKLKGVEDGAEVNVLADWNELNIESDAYIQNKPESLPASDVYEWAKQPTKPSYTPTEIGLGNVTNDAQVKRSEMGVANGVATLNQDGLVPSTQLPSYVDDVLEYSSASLFPRPGTDGKIYVDTTTNLTYRWSGSDYVEISKSLALGETSSTAYRGDRGATAYTHATDSSRLTTATSVGLYKVGCTAQGHISGLTAITKADITGLGIPAQDTNTTYSFAGGTNKFTVTPSGGTAQDVTVTPSISAATQSAAGLMSAADKKKLDGIAAGAQVNSVTGVKGNSESSYRTGNVNITATNIGLSNVANLDLSKAIKSITRSGTTFTYTCLDGTTGTFTLLDNNTTYSAGTGLSLSNTTFSLALTKKLVTDALGYTPPTTDTNTTYSAGSGLSLSGTTFSLALTKAMVTTALGYTPPTSDTNTWRPITNTYTGSDLSTSVSQYGTNALYNALVNGYANSAGNADTVDNLHASNLVRFFLSPMASNAPADSAKSWFTETMPSASGAVVYNVPGAEKTIIAGKSSGAHGHMLQLNYDDNYLRLLRYHGGNWKTTDWEKISAGYADSAGSVSWSNVSSKPETATRWPSWSEVTGKPSTFAPSSHTHNYLPLSGGTMTGSITMSQGASARNVGIVGTYDYTKSAAIWAMGASYQIPAAGNSLGSLYGAAYVYQGLAGQGTMAGGHQFVWAQNGSANAALGTNIWTSGKFIKNGGTSSLFLKADGSVDSNAYITGITKAMVTTALGYTPPTTDTNTWRTVLCNGTSIGSNTLNIKAGTNVSLSNSNGTITISSTDTNTWPSKVSLLTNDTGFITGITKAMVTNALGYTPPTTDTNTWRPLGTGANDACAGNDSRLSNARPASDVYAWAKASTKPSYNHSEISAGNLTVGAGNYYLNMRSGHANYNGGIYYSTPGNEAIVFANKSSVTSWIFATGDVTERTDWRNVTANVQIKNKCLYINKLLGNDVNPAYNLYVNGPSVSKYMKFLNTAYSDFAGYVGAGSSSANYIFLEAYGNNSIIFRTNSELRCLIDGAGKWWFPNHTSLYGGGELNIRGSEAGGTIYLSYCCSMSGNSYWYIPTDGKAKFVSVSLGSDIRKKDIVSNTNISITTIALAPLFKFLWKDKNIDDSVHIGTSAQYWKENTPELVTEEDNEDKTLSIEYSTLGVAASISIAKEVVKMQNKIDTLEQRILQLEELLSKLIK